MSFARVAVLLALVVGVLLRLVSLENRPIHHDEAVNWYLFGGVLRHWGYTYDPTNYHGPLHFQIGALARILGGKSLWVQRLPQALAGVLTLVALAHLYRRRLTPQAVIATCLAACSASLTYYARDAIHETWLTLFSVTAVLCAVRALHDGRQPHRARWALAAGASLGGMIAIKETLVITVASWGVGLVGAALARPAEVRPWLVRARQLWRPALGGMIGVVVLSYTNGLRDWHNLVGLYETWFAWGPRGVEGAGHDKPWPYFLELIWQHEAPLWVCAIPALVLVAWRRHPREVFHLGWALTTTAVYSAIPYKTPWLVLQIVLPWILVASDVLAATGELLAERVRPAAAWGTSALLTAAAAGWMALAAYTVCFVDYDVPTTGLAYVQTNRELREVMQTVRQLAEAAEASERPLTLQTIHGTTYPANWYLRGLSLQQDSRDPLPEALDADIILYAPRDEAEVWPRLLRTYHRRQVRFRGHHMFMAVLVATDVAPQLETEPGWQRLPILPGSFDVPPVPTERQPGLATTWYPGQIPLEAPFQRRVFDRIELRYESDHDKPQWAPWLVVMEGWLQADAAATYEMSLTSDDGSRLWIDGQPVIDNWGVHATETVQRPVVLDVGLHHVRLSWFDLGGLATVSWQWRLAGSTWQVVDGTVLSHGPGDGDL